MSERSVYAFVMESWRLPIVNAHRDILSYLRNETIGELTVSKVNEYQIAEQESISKVNTTDS